MLIIILIAFISLIGLIILHELGHFILAKKFKVKVEEFGLGYPPRLFGKKIGKTVYSLNLLPFGAFVRLYGEEKQASEPGSFFSKPIWQRALIILGGIFSFWILALILFFVITALGTPTVIGDNDNHNLVNPKVKIVEIAGASPAEKAGLKVGDNIIKIRVPSFTREIQKIKDVQELTNQYKGQEIILIIERGGKVFEFSLIPRASPPPGQGPLGVALVRVATRYYPWYLVPLEAAKTTVNLTVLLVKALGYALSRVIAGQPSGVQVMGPVGIFGLFVQASNLGFIYFLYLIAVISLKLALLNLLPIPALDGGKLLFLSIEKLRGKPVKEKTEKMVTNFFFALLLALMVWVTIKDVIRLF